MMRGIGLIYSGIKLRLTIMDDKCLFTSNFNVEIGKCSLACVKKPIFRVQSPNLPLCNRKFLKESLNYFFVVLNFKLSSDFC